jgi:antitoxin ParD1/3/4
MQISLTPEQQEWLEAKVAAGQFGSIEEAAAAAIADSIAGEIDDMVWAKPYIDEARAAVARGDVLTLEESTGPASPAVLARPDGTHRRHCSR